MQKTKITLDVQASGFAAVARICVAEGVPIALNSCLTSGLDNKRC